jgi:hypothetical protein
MISNSNQPDTQQIDSPPKPSLVKTVIAWMLLIAWIGFIYLTLGTVPKWREVLIDRWGQDVFATLTYLFAGIALLSITAVMIVSKKEKKVFPYVWLIAILLLLHHVMTHWITIPVEQIHFIEYGMVGVLAFNALRHHLKGFGLVTAALLMTYFFGMIDECIQGILVNRVGEQRDMYWNGLAGAMAMALIVFSLKPKVISLQSGWPDLRIHLLILAFCLPVQGYFNSTIAQFGHLIRDESIGVVFHSRLQPEELKAYEDNLDHFKEVVVPDLGHISVNTLLDRVHDKIHEEALVHSFRRFYHSARGNYPVAYKETLILKTYFPGFIAGTILNWPADKVREHQQIIGDLAYSTYHSPVAEHLITKFTARQMWTAIIVLELIIIFLLFIRLPKTYRQA